MMNKNTLRTGDVVVMNNGKKATYMNIGGTPIFRYHTDNGSFTYVDKYSNDLVHPSADGYTVKEVYRVSSTIDKKQRNDAIFNPDKMAVYGICISRRNDTDIPIASTPTDVTIGKSRIESLDDTQTGDMIEFANGKFATVFRDMPNSDDCVRFHTDTNSFMPFTRFDGLNHFKREGYNIVRVYRADTTGFSLATSKMFDVIGNPTKMQEYGDVIYDNTSKTDEWFVSIADNMADNLAIIDTNIANNNSNIQREILEALGATLNTINKLLGGTN